MEHVKTAGFYRLTEIIGDAKRGLPPIIPVGKTTWWDGCRTGRYPKPVKISRGVTAWRADDIRKLIEKLSGGGDSPDITQSLPAIVRRGRVPDGVQKNKAKGGKGRR
jgi:hypothetical protein